MALSDLANVVVSTEGPALSQVGFGTILVAAYHTIGTTLTRIYEAATALSSMVTDGFLTTDPAYRAVQRILQQSPNVSTVKIGKMAHAPVRTYKVTPIATNNTTYKLTVSAATTAEASYLSDGTATVDEITAGLVAAITALAITGVTATDNTTDFDVAVTSGLPLFLSGWDVTLLQVEELTPDPGIAADLAAIRAADDDWYGLVYECASKACITPAAAYAEANLTLYGANTSDYQVADSGSTTDIAYFLKGQSYARTVLIYSQTDTGSFAGAAMLGERFPSDPGTGPAAGGVFFGKTLAGVSVDGLTPTVKAAVRAKNCGVYITTASRNHTLDGKTPSGEFADVTRFIDWFSVRTQERVATALLNNERIPYTDSGISVMLSCVKAQLAAGVSAGGFAADPKPTATAPAAADVSTADKSSRKLTGVKAGATLAGAIQLVDPISITVTH